MPNLWHSLYVDLSQKGSHTRVALIRSWLNRSRNHPLVLSCYVPREDDEAVNGLVEDLATRIFDCRELQLVVPHYYYGSVEDIVGWRREMPWLETLGICFLFSPSDYLEPEPGLRIDVESAPGLRTFTLRSGELHRGLFELPWTQLFCIDVDTTMSTHDCLDILRQCPLLRTCHFRAVCQQSPPSIQRLLSHHHLQFLNIWTNQRLGPFLRSVTLPAVQSMEIVKIGGDGNARIWSQREFSSLVMRSNCNLRSLNLVQILGYDTDLVECLIDTTDSLLKLRIVSGDTELFTGEFFKLLTMGVTGISSLCPKLEVIRLCGSLVAPVAPTALALAAIVKSRPKIAFSYRNPLRIQRLAARGL